MAATVPKICSYCYRALGQTAHCPECRAYLRNSGTFLTAKSGYSGDNRVFRYRPMTIDEARVLSHSDHHILSLHIKSRQMCVWRARSNGAVKTWKRDSNRIEVPLKYGMYDAFRDTANTDGIMGQLIVLLDSSGNPTRDESTATV